MTTPDRDDPRAAPPREIDDAFAPAGSAGAPPSDAARDQFVHGVLAFLHLDTPARQAERVRATLAALHAEPSADAPAPIRFPRRAWRAAAGLAAAVLLTTALLAYLIPTTPSATAMVRSSIDAAAKAGDRRYLVTVPRPPGAPFPMPGRPDGQSSPMDPSDRPEQHDPEFITLGSIDLRNAPNTTPAMLVRATNPLGDRVAFGRDALGPWSIRPDGQVSRLGQGGPRPRWVEFGESTVLLDSVEALLAALTSEYDTRRLDPAPFPGQPAGEPFDRLRATRKNLDGPEPHAIDVWINRRTRLVQRLELRWPEFVGRPLESGPRDRVGRPPEGGPRRPGPDDPPPRGPGGPDGPRRPHPGDFEPDRPPPHGPPHGPPPPGPRPEPGMDRGPGPGTGHGRGHGVQGGPRGPRPRFLDGPPDFKHHHRPPPRVIIFDLADAEAFMEDWFTPEPHVRWVLEGRDDGEGGE